MGRAVASMKLIERKRARENMFKKRGENLKKKARELSTLCGVDLCMIMVPAQDDIGPIEALPENPEKMHAVIESYKTAKACNDPRRLKNTTVNDCIEQWIRTKKEELGKKKREKYQTSGEPYRNLPEESRREFVDFLAVKIEALKQMIHDISVSKASAPNFANNCVDLLPLNENYAIQNPMYSSMMSGAIPDHDQLLPETVTYSTSICTGFEADQYMVQPVYDCADGGAGWSYNYLAPPAGVQWVDDQYRSALDQFQNQYSHVGKLEAPYLDM